MKNSHQNIAYVTLLYDDSYIPGVIALNHSLMRVDACTELLVLAVNGYVSKASVNILKTFRIRLEYVEEISSPYPDTPKVFNGIFTKLRILEMVEYKKITYIDADMLVCHNIDELFDKPSWSGVNAGGMLPECIDWVEFNAGFLVVEPNKMEFQSIISMLPFMPSKDRGDQGFLHNYFKDWPEKPELHLDHKYNMYAGHLDRYHELYDYDLTEGKNSKSICLIHFWGRNKPWKMRIPDKVNGTLHRKAFELWWEVFKESKDELQSLYWLI